MIIDRPVEVVFDTVADQTNEPRYNPSMTSSHQVTPGPIGVGTHFLATVIRRGKPVDVDTEFTDFERPHVVGSRSVMAGSTVVGQVWCDPVGPATRFSWDWDVRVGGPARLLAPLIGVIGRRQEHAIWAGLKQYLEEPERRRS